ncbi:MAG: S8 family serine peptidase [Bdellovibrionales bacterium]|nr:S8 family serine peptidase [Bdellovibrionales bacterium]
MRIFVGLILMAAMAFAGQPESVPGEYIVTFKNNKSPMTGLTKELAKRINSTVEVISRTARVAHVKTDSKNTPEDIIAKIKKDPNVDIVEPNYIYHASYSFGQKSNDPLMSRLWGLNNSGQPDSNGQAGILGIDINAEKAWTIQTGSKDVIVAVIDTGVNYNNPDLKDNIWTNEAELNGKDGVDDDNNGYVDDIHGWNFADDKSDPMDNHGHGTHCSGTIGAKGNDGKGIVGVNWNTRIMALKFLDASGSGSLDNALKAIDYATQNGAKVLSNSWGGGGFSETLKAAIERSNKAGAVFVAAAGNESNNNDNRPTYPASYDVPNIISVAAIDNKGKLANFSNYGKSLVHVAAPGVNIYSTTLKGYDSWSGTSMATPHVSGVVALMEAQYPEMSNTEIKDWILKTARPLKSLKNKVKTSGLIDAYAALTKEVPAPDMNDPANWQFMPYRLSSEHPYKASTKNTWEISVPNANEISVYFSKFKTEYRFDKVSLYDAEGTLVQEISGNEDESFSEVIKGNYVKVVFESDKSQEQYGFDVTKVAYR